VIFASVGRIGNTPLIVVEFCNSQCFVGAIECFYIGNELAIIADGVSAGNDLGKGENLL
jgi:hypothetical protein